MAGMKGSSTRKFAPMVKVALKGFRAIDTRTVAARTAMEWRRELLVDLGGASSLSAARLALVESATRTWLYVQHLDAWCLEQASLVNARRKGVHPVVKERLLLGEPLQRTLLALGLDRAQQAAPTLAQIAESIARAKATHGQDPLEAEPGTSGRSDHAGDGASDSDRMPEPGGSAVAPGRRFGPLAELAQEEPEAQVTQDAPRAEAVPTRPPAAS